jgi:hypothetical protein
MEEEDNILVHARKRKELTKAGESPGGGGGKERTMEPKKERNSESRNVEKEKKEGESRRKIENTGMEGSRDR